MGIINSVTKYLDDAAEAWPNKVAFEDEKRSMTFSELRQEALCVAARLIKSGIKKSPVVIFMDKSPECVAAFLGVAYSGNFYTPIDVKMPKKRIQGIIDKLSPKAIILSKSNKEYVESCNIHINSFFYEDVIRISSNSVVLPQVIDTDILYVLFTSGSTGSPKGVVVPHRAVVNYVEWFVSAFEIESIDVMGNQVPFYFDVSIQDIYGTLKAGCRTVLIEKYLFSFPSQLLQTMCRKGINTIIWVPTALCLLADMKGLQSKSLPTLKKVLFCGEVMPCKQLNMWRNAFPNTVFVNLYGPTEACDAMMYYVVDREFSDDEVLPIGKAIENVEVILLDECNDEVSNNQKGELCIRGAALACGYYNDPEQTSMHFCPNPLNKKYLELIYRTGDLAHYNELGELMYDGRKDYQIKHMGYRIELGEIETVVSSVEGVERCCCLYNKMDKSILLIYSGYSKEENIKKHICTCLPHYMHPKKYVHLRVMPINMNGKIDRVVLKQYLSECEKV